MSFVDRKLTVFDVLTRLIAAPFYFVAAGILVNIAWLALAVLLFFLTTYLSAQSIYLSLPDRSVIYTLIGVFVFVLTASIPLVIRDHIRNRGYERKWVPTPNCINVASSYIDYLINCEFNNFYDRFSPNLKYEFPKHQFENYIKFLKHEIGIPASAESVKELKISLDYPLAEYSYDCVVVATTKHPKNRQSSIALFLDSKANLNIVDCHLPGYET